MLNQMEEKIFVEGIAQNPYNYGNLSKPVYIDSIEEFVDMDDRIIPNYVNSLIKKGLVSADEDYVWLTTKGVKFYNGMFELKCA